MKSTVLLVFATLCSWACSDEAPKAGALGGECRLSLEPCKEGLVCRNQGCFPPVTSDTVHPLLDGRIEFIGKSRLEANGEDRTGIRIHIFERLDESGGIAEDPVRWTGEVRVWVEPEEAGRIVFKDGTFNAEKFLVLDGAEMNADDDQPVHIFVACDAQDFGCPPRALIKVAARHDPLVPIVTSRTIRLVGGGTASVDGPTFDFSAGCGNKNQVLLNGDDSDELRDTIHPGPGEYRSGEFTVDRGTADTVKLRYEGGEDEAGVSIDLAFTTRGLAEDFEVREYDDAKRYGAEGSSAGMHISGSGRTCERVTGSFEVFEFELDGARLKTFNATFVQHCGAGEAALRGCVRYGR